jgi:two-component system sensor kinase FixL
VSLLCDELGKSRISNLSRIASLLSEHPGDLAEFIARDPRGRQLPEYLNQLADHLCGEQARFLQEMEHIRRSVQHIMEVVAFQQNSPAISGASRVVQPVDLMEDALRLNAGSLVLQGVQIVREYDSPLPEITIERHKALQILAHLIHNAALACAESGRPDKQVTTRLGVREGRLRMEIVDNGIGIPAANLPRVFDPGFTTRKDGGGGWGLHSSVLAASSLGAVLSAFSPGPGQGATFRLDLPLPSQTPPPP